MSDKTLTLAVAGVVVLLALATMAGLHEQHYRARRGRLLDAHLRGLELRLEACELILREDRLT